MKNPNAKYYQIPSKSQSPNPNAYWRNFKITINTNSQKLGSIGISDFLRAMQIQGGGF
jgi:hypothetical protein